MAVQILNALLLLSAGFIAGNFFAKDAGHPHEPLVIAIPSAPAAKAEVSVAHGRGPASIMPVTQVPVKSENPVDLAAYLLKFGIADVHEACEFAHNRFLDQTVASHARFIEGLENFKDHQAYVQAMGRRLAEGAKFWVGRADLDLEDGRARFEVVMDSHGFMPEADQEDNASCFRAHIRVSFANGHDFSTVTDACTDSLVTKNRNYYLNWESFGDVEIGRKLAVVQIPLPESSGAELEFMRSNGQTWAQAQGFHWEAVPLEQGLALIDQGAPAFAQNRAASEP